MRPKIIIYIFIKSIFTDGKPKNKNSYIVWSRTESKVMFEISALMSETVVSLWGSPLMLTGDFTPKTKIKIIQQIFLIAHSGPEN